MYIKSILPHTSSESSYDSELPKPWESGLHWAIQGPLAANLTQHTEEGLGDAHHSSAPSSLVVDSIPTNSSFLLRTSCRAPLLPSCLAPVAQPTLPLPSPVWTRLPQRALPTITRIIPLLCIIRFFSEMILAHQ